MMPVLQDPRALKLGETSQQDHYRVEGIEWSHEDRYGQVQAQGEGDDWNGPWQVSGNL